MKIACVVVTYNRKELLIDCLKGIYAQTQRINNLILIDNASNDGTKEELIDNGFFEKEGFNYVLMDENVGASGGFYEGLKRVDLQNDWIWIMDDDTIPDPTCLENLIKAANHINNASFFASTVFGPNHEPMNVPIIDDSLENNGYPNWYFELHNKMVKIKSATFVSLLINSYAIQKCGLPCKDFFIWGDDSEYTTRLSRYYGPAYMVGDSTVCHKRYNAKALSIINESDNKRIANYYYYYRNYVINTYCYEGKKQGRKQFYRCIWFAIKIIIKEIGIKKSLVVFKGAIDGRKYQKNYKTYILNQLQDVQK